MYKLVLPESETVEEQSNERLEAFVNPRPTAPDAVVGSKVKLGRPVCSFESDGYCPGVGLRTGVGATLESTSQQDSGFSGDRTPDVPAFPAVLG